MLLLAHPTLSLPAPHSPQDLLGCNDATLGNTRAYKLNLLLYEMNLLDTTIVTQVSLTGGFGATKLVQVRG